MLFRSPQLLLRRRNIEELARYIVAGYTTFILDIPPTEEELRHTSVAFAQAFAEGAK